MLQIYIRINQNLLKIDIGESSLRFFLIANYLGMDIHEFQSKNYESIIDERI